MDGWLEHDHQHPVVAFFSQRERGRGAAYTRTCAFLILGLGAIANIIPCCVIEARCSVVPYIHLWSSFGCSLSSFVELLRVPSQALGRVFFTKLVFCSAKYAARGPFASNGQCLRMLSPIVACYFFFVFLVCLHALLKNFSA